MPAAPNNEQSKNPDFVQNLLFFLVALFTPEDKEKQEQMYCKSTALHRHQSQQAPDSHALSM